MSCVTPAGLPVWARLARWRVRLGFAATAVALLLAKPTWQSWGTGLVIAVIGEAIRVWAAGHLEKGKEVTRSGPYRWIQHPLYVGSAVMSVGVVVAARSVVVAIVAALYMATTIAAAVRTEETALRQAFGSTYDDYRASRGERMVRSFEVSRVLRNREYRAMLGVAAGFALLALRIIVLL